MVSSLPTDRAPALSVRNLTTVFQTREGVVRAVDNLSFDVYPGECVGIVGESGSGKSVASLSIMGLIGYPGRVDQGQVEFGGRDLLLLNDKQMRSIRGTQIGIIFQDPLTALNPLFTVGRQMTDVVRAHRKVSKSDAAALAVEKLRLVGVSAPESRLSAYPWELSGGLRQRVAIAMALLLDPQLIIADEPTTALDVSIQAQIIELLRSLKDQLNFSLIFVSHDLGVIRSIADRVIVMYAGHTLETSQVDALFQQPNHPYTAALLGSAPTLASDPNQPLPAIEGRLPSLNNVPKGCVFAPRCHFSTERCVSERPLLQTAGQDGRQVACFYPLGAPVNEGVGR
ncbi:MAG: ABC transporter ATP-binding protein [Thermomicrobiales bacterium]|nr:ABC transporter ATP-binding protein [Thermomicrobiales bacterium]